MECRTDPDSSRIEVLFEGEGELREFVGGARTQSAFLLQITDALVPFAAYTVVLKLEGGFEIKLEATVVQFFADEDPPAAAFQIERMAPAWQREFERKLRMKSQSADHSEMTGVPPIVRIRKMNVRERMHLATKADRTERATLQRDSSPQVLMGLVTNPRIGADDIVQIIRNPQVSAGVLDRITKETRWLANPEIQKALVRNPKTPSLVAIRLVDTLPTEELRRLAKIQSGLREDLRKAALRAYLKRNKR